MSNYTFGSRSLQKLQSCHDDLQQIMELALLRSDVDFGISEGHRSLERQYQLYLEGKSKISGLNKKGKHNYNPSLAVDIYCYHFNLQYRRKIAYSKEHLCYIAGIIQSVAKELYMTGKIEHLVRWGANWDKDGILALDQSFDDYPHFELYKP